MLDAITGAAGLLCAAIGVTVLVAWFVRATVILRFGSPTPMSVNSALFVALTGAALVAVSRGHPRAALVAGVFDVALGLAVLAEYALGRSLGIDQLILHPYLSEPHGAPGRLGINTAVCVTLAGATLLVWGPWRRRHGQPSQPWADPSSPLSPSSRPSGTPPAPRLRTAGDI